MEDFSKQRAWGPDPNYPRVKKYRASVRRPFYLIAGPCSVENRKQIFELAKIVADAGATHLRGGIFRAGTYPGKCFGLIDMDLIEAYAEAAANYGLDNIIEVLDPEAIPYLARHSAAFQIGCRQMQNYALLRKLGEYQRDVFIKRHPGSNMHEFLGAAEHVLASGCATPVLIERGTSTHMNHVRWDLSISIIPAIKAITEIPIICDASHGTGRRDLVSPMALAGIAAGADGVLIEVHKTPDKSISDKEQAITPATFKSLAKKIEKLRKALED